MTKGRASGSPVVRRGLHRDVVDGLGRKIVHGVYPTGTTLPNEAELSSLFEVSRSVLREAVKVLAAKGLVETRPKIGTRVLPRSTWHLIDADVLQWLCEVDQNEELFENLAEVRSIVEPRASALAAQRRTDEEMDLIEELVGRLERSIDDPAAYVALDLELHTAILRATHNELLVEMTDTITVALRASRSITLQVPGGAQAAMVEHRKVVTAIRAGDAYAAARAMADLTTGVRGDIKAVLGAPRADDGTRPPME
jgi:DNA-binding FadR family transcriptional regulator